MRDSSFLVDRWGPGPIDVLRRSSALRKVALSSAALALGFALAGCSGDTKGQIILALQTDMSMPADVTKVKIEVKADGVSRFDQVFVVDPEKSTAEQIPATLAVVAGEKENETVELKVIALRDLPNGEGDEPRTLNKTITTIPKERIAMLRVPMQWLCTNQDTDPDDNDHSGDFITDLGDGEYESACDPMDGKETACVAGGCQDVHVDSSHLPDFEADAVFGGADDPGKSGTCFPTEACFDAGETLIPDENCVVSYTPENDEILNFAILAVNGGICRGDLCYVPLDKTREFGWYELDDGEVPSGAGGAPSGGEGGAGADVPTRVRRFKLPQGACNRIDDGRARGVRVSTDEACEVTKTPRYPTCGPWSSVGGNVEPPPPPPTDADGDGFDGPDVGGDDCDDKDETINPDAPEICDDGIDNDCNDEIDDCLPDNDGDGVDGIDSGGTDCDDNDNTVYPGALEACDELDNDCNLLIDDNCLADLPFSHRVDFSALDGFTSSANYAIYQEFDATRQLDLDHQTLTFEPNSAHTRYTITAGALEWDDDLGELVPVTDGQDISNCDDCFATLSLEFPFDFYGNEYTTVFPGSNGYLTFGVGDSNYTENVQDFLAKAPRIAAFWDDLDTRGTPGTIDDEVHYFSDDTKLVVTYQNIQIYSSSMTSNTFQFVLLADGTIKISYDGMDDLDQTSIAGITPGSIGSGMDCGTEMSGCYGTCVDLLTDEANCGACGNRCATDFCSAGECVGDTKCTVSNAPCEGICVGSCQLATPGGPCDGTCFGTCAGTCTPDPGAGSCSGTCDGDCTGSCSLTDGGSCPDACSGTCYVDSSMACPDPTIDFPGPCNFTSSSVSATSCYDSATTADGASFTLSCSGSGCQCTKSAAGASVAMTLATPTADVCETATTLRAALMRDCIGANSACGDGCPATQPAARAACNEAEIDTCYYSMPTSTYCMCMGGNFVCQ